MGWENSVLFCQPDVKLVQTSTWRDFSAQQHCDNQRMRIIFIFPFSFPHSQLSYSFLYPLFSLQITVSPFLSYSFLFHCFSPTLCIICLIYNIFAMTTLNKSMQTFTKAIVSSEVVWMLQLANRRKWRIFDVPIKCYIFNITNRSIITRSE